MKNYRALQIKLKDYREAGFAVPALSAKYAQLLNSYQRIQSILQGQSCELPTFAEVVPYAQKLNAMRRASPDRRNQQQQQRKQSICQWLLIGISVPLSMAMMIVLLPVIWIQERHKSENAA